MNEREEDVSWIQQVIWAKLMRRMTALAVPIRRFS